jgi:hypothetical protein
MELQVREIQDKIYEVRDRKIMFDFDLAAMYGMETKRRKEAVRRNIKRFEGDDFMIVLSREEVSRSQIASLNKGRGGNIKYLPFAFTDLGIAMLSSVLNSETAIEVNRNIMRAFVALRQMAMVLIELHSIKEQIQRLKRDTDENTEAINDLSEDIGKELETIYDAIGALSIKQPQLNKPRPKVGFKRGSEQ